MPILKCWPEDGGRFITLPLVRTRDPSNRCSQHGHIPNAGVTTNRTTGMHMQIQKGGAFHHADSERALRPLDMPRLRLEEIPR